MATSLLTYRAIGEEVQPLAAHTVVRSYMPSYMFASQAPVPTGSCRVRATACRVRCITPHYASSLCLQEGHRAPAAMLTYLHGGRGVRVTRQHLHACLSRYVEEGRLVRQGYGVYALPAAGE